MMNRCAKVVLEAIGLALATGLLGLAVNALSPQGLSLSRQYFAQAPVDDRSKSAEANRTSSEPPNAEETSAPETRAENVTLELESQLQERGVEWAAHEQVVQWFQDEETRMGGIIFVDARDRAHYEEGHIPGAYLFNPYRMEEHLDTVLPACQIARRVVVYCAGGDCEDSQFAARDLINMGVAASKISIYKGGMNQWTAQNLPLEQGRRLSGEVGEH